MNSCLGPEEGNLSAIQIAKIKSEIELAAEKHLHAMNAETALRHYDKDVIAATNGKLYTSLDARAQEIQEYYRNLKQVNFASWEEMHIQVITAGNALATATFRYGFTNSDNEAHAMKGVWTALFVRRENNWKISMLHESFVPLDE